MARVGDGEVCFFLIIFLFLYPLFTGSVDAVFRFQRIVIGSEFAKFFFLLLSLSL